MKTIVHEPLKKVRKKGHPAFAQNPEKTIFTLFLRKIRMPENFSLQTYCYLGIWCLPFKTRCAYLSSFL